MSIFFITELVKGICEENERKQLWVYENDAFTDRMNLELKKRTEDFKCDVRRPDNLFKKKKSYFKK